MSLRVPIALLLATSSVVAVQQPTFKSSVDVVTVDVSVSRGGEHVGGLSAANFDLFDNGARQKLDKVTLEQVPLEAFLVFDVSGSVEGAKLQQLEAAAAAFLDGLVPRDKVALITFAGKVEVRQPLTGDRAAFREALSEIKAGGQTALFDAALRAIRLREHNDNRAVVVVLTDQHDNASTATQKQVIEAAERSDVIAYGVLAEEESSGGTGMTGRMGGGMGGGGFRPPQMQFQIGFLRSLADTTGGRVFRTSARLSLEDAFSLVLDDARTRYILTYRPDKAAAGWHKLQVKLVDAKGDVVARRGYYVEGPFAGK
jgi:Ca-activated chloride channel homolog